MNIFRKTFLLCMLVVLVGTLTIGCAQKKEKDTYKIGLFQVAHHVVLDAMTKEFQDTLSKEFPGKIIFDLQIPEGDSGKTEQMAAKFATGNYDLVFVLGTNPAQSLSKKTNKTPIVLGAVTDPQKAGLVDSWDKPGRNITGTSDLSPISAQLDYLLQAIPNAKHIGIIFNPSEDNSKIIVKKFEEECAKKGLSAVKVTIASPNEVRQTLISLVGKVDALYAPTDATVQSAFGALAKVANEVKIPIFNCDEGTAKNGAFFSVGFDYKDLGKISAEMAIKILKDKQQPATMPIRMANSFQMFYNARQFEILGLKIPDAWNKNGKEVSK